MEARLRRRLSWGVVAGLLATMAFRFLPTYSWPWRLAAVGGLAVGALAYVILRTGDQLRDLYRRH